MDRRRELAPPIGLTAFDAEELDGCEVALGLRD
jgi:hypothetical protein